MRQMYVARLPLEYGQAKVRCANVMVGSIYCAALSWNGIPLNFYTFHILFAYGFVCVSALISTRSNPKFSLRRVGALLVLDQIFIALLFYVANIYSVPFLFVPAVASIGYGVRYGTKFVYLSTGVTLIVLPVVMYFSEFWRSMPLISLGIVFGSCYLPLYGALMSDGMRRQLLKMRKRSSDLVQAVGTASEAKENAERKLRIDTLTGLLNRLGFEEALEKSVNDHAKAKTTCALVLLDLDGFKEINDQCGHDVGDDVLRAVATTLHQHTSFPAHVARHGGDEFAIVYTQFEQPNQIIELVKNSVHALSTVFVDGNLKVSTSAGICFLPNTTLTSREALFKAADELMYLAKRSGKNRIVTSLDRNFTASGRILSPV